MGEKPVKVKDAPGLKWFKRRDDIWEARWRCRADLVERGFIVPSMKMWSGTGEPTKEEWDWMADKCRELQQEMLVFARGGLPEVIPFDGTLASLMRCYMADEDSPYQKLRYRTRQHYDAVMKLIGATYGEQRLAELKARTFLRWHEGWLEGGKVAVAHLKVGMLRTLFGFGATMLEDAECERLSGVLHRMKFKMPGARSQRLTAEQAIAVRAAAHKRQRPSIALAQAFQFECMLRQRDVIGEWLPLAEPGISDLTAGDWKWLRGLRWEEIDEHLILRHVTSKRQKTLTVNLNNAPMVLEELALFGERKAKGPIIVSEWDGLPWETAEFRRWWRIIATEAGVPKEVKNMDTRSGAISEATDAGADLEHVRHAATHSNISMTQRYSRGAEQKIEGVQLLRVEHRNKTRTE